MEDIQVRGTLPLLQTCELEHIRPGNNHTHSTLQAVGLNHKRNQVVHAELDTTVATSESQDGIACVVKSPLADKPPRRFGA
jgi:hypothetical protein